VESTEHHPYADPLTINLVMPDPFELYILSTSSHQNSIVGQMTKGEISSHDYQS